MLETDACTFGTQGQDNSILVPSVKDQVATSLAANVPRTLDIYAIFVGSNDFLMSEKGTSGADVASLIEKRVSQLYKAGTYITRRTASAHTVTDRSLILPFFRR